MGSSSDVSCLCLMLASLRERILKPLCLMLVSLRERILKPLTEDVAREAREDSELEKVEAAVVRNMGASLSIVRRVSALRFAGEVVDAVDQDIFRKWSLGELDETDSADKELVECNPGDLAV